VPAYTEEKVVCSSDTEMSRPAGLADAPALSPRQAKETGPSCVRLSAELGRQNLNTALRFAGGICARRWSLIVPLSEGIIDCRRGNDWKPVLSFAAGYVGRPWLPFRHHRDCPISTCPTDRPLCGGGMDRVRVVSVLPRPLDAVAALALPILWLSCGLCHQAPTRRRFPGVALLLPASAMPKACRDRTPWWLLLLRMLAVAAADHRAGWDLS